VWRGADCFVRKEAIRALSHCISISTTSWSLFTDSIADFHAEIPTALYPEQVLQILDGVEIAPSVQIHTGQDGTTQIPPAFPVAVTTEDESTGVGTRDNDAAPASDRAEDSTERDPDERPSEYEGKPEHPSEFYDTMPSSGMDVDS
jgi:hypothetical protein